MISLCVINKKSLIYAVNIFLGSCICWYSLTHLGLPDPMWAIITVILVSDPDLSTLMTLSKMRVINTLVGCVAGFVCLLAFGYNPWISFCAAAIVIIVITSLENYPANWRLTPVTIFIVMNASKNATTYHEEVMYSVMRAGEILFGCIIALIVSYTQVKLTLFARSRMESWKHHWE